MPQDGRERFSAVHYFGERTNLPEPTLISVTRTVLNIEECTEAALHQMKNFIKAIALCLALLLCLSFPVGASAAEVEDATIDTTAKGSLTIYKYNLTVAAKDDVWDSSYYADKTILVRCVEIKKLLIASINTAKNNVK